MTGADDTGAEPVGSATEEALKLLRALATGGRSGPQDSGEDAPEPHTCPNGWCPVCRVTDWVRDNPEVFDHVADTGLMFARSLREALDMVIKAGDQRDPEPPAQ